MMPMVIVAGTYNRHISKAQLYQALQKIIIENPLLTVNIFNISAENSKPAPVFRQILNFDLDNLVQFLPDETDLEELVNNQLFNSNWAQSSIDYNDELHPCWRLYVIGGQQQSPDVGNSVSQLVWGFDHCAFDGNSGAIFHSKLLNALNNPEEPLGETPNLVSLSETTNLSNYESLEDKVDVRPPLIYLAKTIYRELFNSKSSVQESPDWASSPPSLPFKSQTIFFDIESGKLKQLLAKARKMSTSLTGILAAIHMKSIHAYLKATSGKSIDRELIYSCPIDARRYFADNSGKPLGNYVLAYDHPIKMSSDIKDKPVQTVASDFISALNKCLIDKSAAYLVGLLGYTDVRNYLLKASTQIERRSLGEISNLGNISASEGEASKIFALTKLVFAQASSSMGAPYLLSCVSVPNGPLSISLSVANDDQSRSHCLEIRDYFLTFLEELLNDGE